MAKAKLLELCWPEMHLVVNLHWCVVLEQCGLSWRQSGFSRCSIVSVQWRTIVSRVQVNWTWAQQLVYLTDEIFSVGRSRSPSAPSCYFNTMMRNAHEVSNILCLNHLFQLRGSFYQFPSLIVLDVSIVRCFYGQHFHWWPKKWWNNTWWKIWQWWFISFPQVWTPFVCVNWHPKHNKRFMFTHENAM